MAIKKKHKPNNPYNERSVLYRKLTRLFSGPIVNYNVTRTVTGRTRELEKYKFKSANGKAFKKIDTPFFDQYQSAYMANASRAERYIDFDQMEYYPELAAALNIYADEVTTHSDLSEILKIKCQNEEIKSILYTLFYDVLDVEHNLYGWVRSLCKKGDYVLYLDIEEEAGIINVLPLPIAEVERLEGEDPTNPFYIQFQWNRNGATFENWQIAHFRLIGDDRFIPYGMSVMEPARRVWRQLMMLEDAMMGYRIVRSPERRVFYIDVGGIPPDDVEQYLETIKNNTQRNTVIDTTTGRSDMRYNPHPIWKDSPIPLLNGEILTIEQLAREYEAGKENWVYSINDNTHEIVPGKVVWCGKNYTTEKMIKVWLDDNTWVMTAPEHPFILRDGSRKRADELLINDSLMPFYRNKKQVSNSRNEYESIYQPDKDKFDFTHRIVAKSANHKQLKECWDNLDREKNKGLVVHHKDCNPFNNLPENLEWMGVSDHSKLHRKNGRNFFLEWNKTEEHSRATSERNKKINSIKKMHDAYHFTDLFYEHNEIRSEAMKAMWADESKAKKAKKNMTINFDDKCFDFFIETAKILEGRTSIDEFGKLLLGNSEFIEHFQSINGHTKKDPTKSLHRHGILKRLREYGYDSYCNFLDDLNPIAVSKNKSGNGRRHGWNKNPHPKNHKVLMIDEVYVTSDVYCMTVEGPNGENDRHNFAVLGFDTNNEVVKSSGLFINNSIEDNYYIPIRGDKSSRIETLPGGQFTGDIDDVEYLRDKLFSAIMIPKSYLAQSDSTEDQTSLSQKDIRFARTIQRIQRAVVSELWKIAVIHLYTLGYRADDLTCFDLSLNNPSRIAELQELEHWRTLFDIANGASDGFFSQRWIYKNIFNLSDEDVIRNKLEMYHDAKFRSDLDSIANASDAMADGGMGMDGSMGGIDAGALGGGLDVADMEAPDEGTDDSMLLDEPGGEDDELPPGKRDDSAYLTPGSKGKWYTPKKTDTRRSSGPRSRSFKATANIPRSRGSLKNLFGGGVTQFGRMATGIPESVDDKEVLKLLEESKKNKDIELEDEIFNIRKDINNLINEAGFKIPSSEDRKILQEKLSDYQKQKRERQGHKK